MANSPSKFITFAASVFLLLFAGCARVSVKEGLPVYSFNGTRYLPLVSLCSARHIEYAYDSFSRVVTLSRDGHTVNLRVADSLILVDGLPQSLRYPVDIYKGTIVVPYRFKEQVIDALFKGAVPEIKHVLPPSRIKKIVIDAGHGGNDPGAIGRSGLREKDVNLDIAKRLGQLLRKEGVEVVFTRNSDTFISLERRVTIANSSGADIFISVHANANRVRSLKGFEVYYVSPTVSDTQRAASAAKNCALQLDCITSTFLSPTTKAILWDLIYAYGRAEAIQLSRSICNSISKNLDTEILGVKAARYYVLKGVQMPGVLVEVGFVSNKNEEQYLKNYYYRQKIAEGIHEGVRNYAREVSLAESTGK